MSGARTGKSTLDSQALVLRRLGRLAPLSEAEQALVRAAQGIETVPAGAEITAEGAAPRDAWIISGWAILSRMLQDGRRQVLSFRVPGDVLGMSTTPGPTTMYSTFALTPMLLLDASSVVATVRSSPSKYPGLVKAFQIFACYQEAWLIDQVVRLGRQSAYERVCHLLLELHHRLAEVGVADGDRFPLPMTQETLADATGLSMVHVNRTLQQLRREQMIELRAGMVTMLKPAALVALADFQPPDCTRWDSGEARATVRSNT